MIIFRIIQGVGGGSLVPVSQAILRETFPPREQGMAMGLLGIGVMLAPATGPILGGWLTDHYGWPWIFYVNVPISVPAILLALVVLRDPPYLKRGIRRIDWPGIILLTVCLTALQTVLAEGQRENWLESKWIVLGMVVALLCLVALVLQELRVPEPVVNLRLFRNRPLAVGSAIGLAFGVALTGTTFILPQFTQTLLGYPALQSGMVLMPRAIPMIMLLPVAGLLFTYLDARLLVVFGLGMICWAYYDLAHLSLQAGYWNMVPMLLLMGVGMPFMFVTLTTVSLSSMRKYQMTDAASLYTLTRTVGGNIGYAIVATLVANGTQIHRASLVKNISDLNLTYLTMERGAAAHLLSTGADPVRASKTALALVNQIVNRQAAMMAYNDTAATLGFMFLVMLPLVLLLPGRPESPDVVTPVAE
jgi:DHA2 family multidrug resistance protein